MSFVTPCHTCGMGTDIYLYVEQRDVSGQWNSDGVDHDLMRNYSLFGWLANVRNDDQIQPIDQPRGLPADLSDVVAAEADLGCYAASFFYLDELLAQDYEAPIKQWGVVNDRFDNGEPGRAARLQEYADEYGCLPYDVEYSRGYSGPRENEYVQLEWTSKLSTALGGEWAYLMLRLWRQARGDLRSVRVVFWFD